jgi:hypothetical protein
MKTQKRKKKVLKEDVQWCKNPMCGKKIKGLVAYSHGKTYCSECFNQKHDWNIEGRRREERMQTFGYN